MTGEIFGQLAGRGVGSALLAVGLCSGCGAAPPAPVMEGRDGMLSRTAISQKCEEAARDHDRPFVIEWDATDLASFEAKAKRGTVLVAYEGCELKPMYECSDSANPAAFGTYGHPQFTSGTTQGFDVTNEGELYAQLPLGAAKLSARVQKGEKLHLEYFVSGVATSSRDAIYAGDLGSAPGCPEVTHFVWAYNLGAFELTTSTESSSAAEASAFGAGIGGSGKNKEAQAGKGGEMASCKTQDQRACRVPIRLTLRAVRPGSHPKGALPGVPGVPPPGAGGDVAAAIEHGETQRKLADMWMEANRKLNEHGDGKACLEIVDRILVLDPRWADNPTVPQVRSRCLMRAGRCDEGTKDYRALMAAKDVKRLKSDEDLDEEVRKVANRECPASTAKNDVDFLIRSEHEMRKVASAKDGPECRKRFAIIKKRLAKIPEKAAPCKGDKNCFAERRKQSRARQSALSSLEGASKCIAMAESCKAGLPFYTEQYKLRLRTVSGVEKIAAQAWATQIKMGSLKCKQ